MEGMNFGWLNPPVEMEPPSEGREVTAAGSPEAGIVRKPEPTACNPSFDLRLEPS